MLLYFWWKIPNFAWQGSPLSWPPVQKVPSKPAYLRKLLNRRLLRVSGKALIYNGDRAGIKVDHERSFRPSGLKPGACVAVKDMGFQEGQSASQLRECGRVA